MDNMFWLQKPKMMGIRGWSLFIPAIASSVGFFCFAVLGFSFTELEALAQGFRTALVLVGAFTLAFGSEVGTLSSVVEIYRKGEKLGKWDRFALGVSVLSTFAAFVLAFATLLGVKATWGEVVKLYGPIVLGVLAALDSYGGFLEFGLYLNGYDKRLASWERKHNEYVKDQALQELEHKRLIAEQKLNLQLAQIDAQKVSNTEKNEQNTQDIEHARSVKAQQDAMAKAQRFEQILKAYTANPQASPTRLAERMGVSRTTVYSDRKELVQDGKLKKNGVGYLVVDDGA